MLLPFLEYWGGLALSHSHVFILYFFSHQICIEQLLLPKKAPGYKHKEYSPCHTWVPLINWGISKIQSGASLVAQWLRVCLPMQGTRVRALVWEDPTCRGATKPVSHKY